MPSKEEIEAIGRIKYNDIAKPLYCGDLTICNIEDLEIVINLVERQQKELEQLEVEKTEREKTNDKYLQKLVYALSPTNHLLDNYYNRSFKKIIAENIDLETDKIKKMLKDCWEGRY